MIDHFSALGMADEGNEDQIRRMDLNLYLGLPRRPPELGLGSDLALGSLPVPSEEQEIQIRVSLAEISSSQTPSYPSLQSTQPPSEITRDGSHLEYSLYSPSYGPVSPTAQTSLEQPLDHDVDDPLVHAPYFPSYVPISPVEQDSTEAMVNEGSSNNHVEYVPYSLPYVPAPLSPPPEQANESEVQEDNTHVPYVPVSPTTHVHDDHHSTESLPEVQGFGLYRGPVIRDGSAQRELLQCPEVRFRRLIESNRRSRIRTLRRFRSTVPYIPIPYSVDPDLGPFSSTAGHVFRDVTVSERSIETNSETHKTSAEGLAAENLEDEGTRKDQSSGAANFDCNVCLDVAKEPVVTSCGHLFCWPCLYQWLHLHSDHKECPVCKGEVTESNITPIYGRGSCEREVEKEHHEEGDSRLKIPPRPCGQRFESSRQRIRRPLSRRSGEEIGSWRFIDDDEMHNRAEGQEEPSVQGIFDRTNRRLLSRLIAAQRFQREDNLENRLNLGGSGSSRSATEMSSNQTQNVNSLPDGLHGGGSRNTPPAHARQGIDFWPPLFSFYGVSTSDRLAAIAADLNSVVGRMANGSNNSGASASASMNPQESNALNVQGTLEAVVAADQASASSTIAVIQDDTGVPIDAPTEPNSVGSSRTLRRRRRSSVPGSLDVDGGVHHARKRRRLN